MLKIYTVVGARPQFIKAAAVSRRIADNFSDKIQETIVHTGQHFDDNMSKVFFQELSIPEPKHNLEVGPGTHAEMTGKIKIGLEKLINEDKPDCIVTYGDTNSTIAAALTASKMGIPVAHVEAGLRSYDKTMPEEINRLLTDHVSSFLFCPTEKAVENLMKEGIDGIFKHKPTADQPLMLNVGDVMYDNILFYSDKFKDDSDLKFDIEPGNYIYCTVHRDFNTDNTERLNEILFALLNLADVYKYNILFPMHPRTSKRLAQPEFEYAYKKLASHSNITVTEPMPYFENLKYLNNSRAVITDSGGVQKEAFFLKKPSVLLRSTTEWTEIVDAGYAVCADAFKDDIISSTMKLLGNPLPEYEELFGDGEASLNIVQSLSTFL